MFSYNAFITIGCNVKDAKPNTLRETLNSATQVLGLKYFTAYEVNGMYKFEREQSLRIEICNLSAKETKKIKSLIPVLAAELNQECIMFETKRIKKKNCIFIESRKED